MPESVLDSFLVRALLAGLGVALVAGPLGCFVVWRRLAYFGDTTAHAALLGVVLALALSWPPWVGVLAVALAIAGLMSTLARGRGLGSDTLLGVLSHGALALGLVAVALMASRVNLLGFLFGDILAVSRADLAVIWIGALAVLGALIALWRPLLAATIDTDLARAEGLPTDLLTFALMALVSLVIALAMKVVGVLLVTALLLIPPATVRPLAPTPEAMALGAALAAAVAVGLGLGGSFVLDTPAGPSIVVGALALFVGTTLGAALVGLVARRRRGL